MTISQQFTESGSLRVCAASPSATVSILMPMRNAAPYVKRALQSILREQDVKLEVIVVDDGSTDDSRAMVEALGDPRVTIVDGPCEGIPASFNKALETASGDIIMRCDADDLYPEGRIRRQVEWLTAHPEFGALCGTFSATDRRNWFECELVCAGPQAREITTDLRHGRVDTHFCTFAVRAEVARRTPARTFFRTGSDIDMQLRLSEQCRVWYEPCNAYLYRLIDTSITHSTKTMDRDFYEKQARRFQSQRRRKGFDDLDMGLSPERPTHAADRCAASDQMQGILTARCWIAFHKGNRAQAFTYALRAIVVRPFAFAAWRNLAVLMAKTVLYGQANDEIAARTAGGMVL